MFKVRKYILQHYEYEQVIDKIWFSELEIVNEDNVNSNMSIGKVQRHIKYKEEKINFC
ncbi:hypothetical protein [Orientia tsutsugamushi]|uniref:hypothetical protein n=1 Tax=Orientia tsutsugamushi TaxID=784 RepID=UPI000A7673B8|nr:hypothetical protein [Orientia tsutsugamushi]